MPDYVFLLYGEVTDGWNVGDESWEEGMAAHEKFSAAVVAAGAEIVGGAALPGPETARTIRGPKRIVHDGPFAETKEVLGGFYVIRATDLDAALELAKLCPEQTIEVRESVG